MRLIEIHKNGINFHYPVASYYGIDYNSKKKLFEVSTPQEAFDEAKKLGYKEWEIQMHFNYKK